MCQYSSTVYNIVRDSYIANSADEY